MYSDTKRASLPAVGQPQPNFLLRRASDRPQSPSSFHNKSPDFWRRILLSSFSVAMEPSQDFKSLQDKVQASLLSTTRTVNGIASEDLTFQRTANPRTGDRLDDLSTRLLGVSAKLINGSAKANDQRTVDSLEDTDDVDIQWAGIVDVIDGLLEKADTALDEYTGRVKRKTDIPEPPPSKKLKTNDRYEPNWRRANIIKPQNAFEKQVDNFATGPWKPLLTNKPHATVPLEESLGMTVDEKNKSQYEYGPFFPFL